MIKKIFYFFLFVIVVMTLFLLTYDNQPKFYNYQISKPLIYHPDLASIEMVFIRMVESHNRVHARIYNDTEHKIATAPSFRLEFFDGNDWRVVPVGEGWLTSLDILPIRESGDAIRRFNLDMFYPIPSVDLFRIRLGIGMFWFDEFGDYVFWSDYYNNEEVMHELVMEFYMTG